MHMKYFDGISLGVHQLLDGLKMWYVYIFFICTNSISKYVLSTVYLGLC
jgi:hypothetical protein